LPVFRMPSADDVLDRLKQLLAVSSDGELARALGVKRSTLGSWRSHQRVPYEICVGLHESRGVSLDWLLAGTGQMRPGVAEPGAEYGRQPETDALLSTLEGVEETTSEAIIRDALARAEAARELQELRELVATLRSTLGE
jgi:hypothetical protein